MKYGYFTLDVFTGERFGGNPLAVLPYADGLDGDQMQRIAREFNLSETTFVLPPRETDNTAHVRIFTPAAEMPFAGHPTIGTAIVLAEIAEAGNDAFERQIRLEEQVGLLSVEVTKQREMPPFGQFTNAVLPEPVADVPPVDMVAKALSLSPDDVGAGGHAPGLHVAGNTFLFAPLRDMDAVARAEIEPAAWKEISGGRGWVGVFVYTQGGESSAAHYRARMFGPDFGVPEDPATGSAAATFPGQIAASEDLSDGTHKWFVEQGYEMGRPSQIHIEADVAGGALTAVRVGGRAVRVSQGEIEV
ncbi:MAG: PhzF family phenazine biosynthesis protein [Hyphomicrobiales bacterium]